MNKRDMKINAELAEQCYVNPSEFDYKKYAALIRADEREECAKVAEKRWLDTANCTAEQMYEMQKKSIADAIRARGQA